MSYCLGTTYELDTVDLRFDQNTGVQYIVVRDEDREYRIYNVLKCQYENLPSKLYVTPRTIDVYGRVIFKQDEREVFAQHYTCGEKYAFHVDDIKTDYNDSQKQFYVISDDFAEHHYYFKPDKKIHSIGDDIELIVEDQTDKGFLKFKEVGKSKPKVSVAASSMIAQQSVPSFQDDDKKHDYAFLDLEESSTIELKSSIVFPAGGNGVPDIDAQMKTIVKELAAFMNSKGGKLYIGIHDKTKEIIGIEQDLPHLNSGSSSYTYHSDIDSYQRVVRDSVTRQCNGLANNLIEFEFNTEGGHQYCVIDVKEAPRPIWVNGLYLYTRTGNQVTQLKGEDITSHIYQRTSISILDKIDFEDTMPTQETLNDIVRLTLKEFINENKPKPTVVNVAPEEVEYYIVWKNDRSWSRQKNQSTDSDVAFQIPVRKSDRDCNLVFCYANGRVNEVELSKFKSGTRLGDIKQKGFCEKSTLMNIFLAQKSNFLAAYSVDANGQKMVKVHHVGDINTTASASNQGATFVPDTGKVTMYKLISGAYVKIIKPLILQKNQTSQSFGFPTNSGNVEIASAISKLNNI